MAEDPSMDPSPVMIVTGGTGPSSGPSATGCTLHDRGRDYGRRRHSGGEHRGPADDWRRFVEQQKTQELDQLIDSEALKPDETRAFVDRAFRDGAVPTTGTAITTIMPPVSRFSATGGTRQKKKTVLDKLTAFFVRCYGLT